MFNHPDQELTFFELFYSQKDTGNKGVSLLQPFKYTATFIIIVSATMRYITSNCNIEFTSLITNKLIIQNLDTKYLMWIIAGDAVSNILSSLIFTFVFKRQLAITMIFFLSLNILYQM